MGSACGMYEHKETGNSFKTSPRRILWTGLISEYDYCPLTVGILSVLTSCCFKTPNQRTSVNNDLKVLQELIFVLNKIPHFIVCDISCSINCEIFAKI